MYDVLLIVHIVAAMVWVGGGIYTVLQDSRIRSGGERLEIAIEDSDWAGTRVFGPAAVVTLLAGVGMVVSSEAWAFSQTWVWMALVLVVISIGIGAGFYGPAYERIRTLNRKADSGAELAAVRRGVALVSRIDALLLVTVVVLMVTRPGL